MFEKTQLRRTRERIAVRIELTGGQTLDGDLFAYRDERLSDLLNDERAFVPLERGENHVEVIAKSQIAHVRPIAEGRPVPGDDPYRLLKVEAEASDAEIREAWRRRLKTCHPDRLMAMDLDPEIVITARDVCQRLNAAYDTIMAARKARAE